MAQGTIIVPTRQLLLYVLARRAGMGLFLRQDDLLHFVPINGLLGVDPIITEAIVGAAARRWHPHWTAREFAAFDGADPFSGFFEVFIDDETGRVVEGLDTKEAMERFAEDACAVALECMAKEASPLLVRVSGGLEDAGYDEVGEVDLAMERLETRAGAPEVRRWIYRMFYRRSLNGLEAAHLHSDDLGWVFFRPGTLEPSDVRHDLEIFPF